MTAIRRSLRDDERELLLALVERDQNRSYLVQQIAGISQVEDWNDGTNTITLALGSNYRSRIYALADDEDGASIDITLFARGDILCVLEVLRPDGLPIKRYPTSGALKDVWDHNGSPRPVGW